MCVMLMPVSHTFSIWTWQPHHEYVALRYAHRSYRSAEGCYIKPSTCQMDHNHFSRSLDAPNLKGILGPSHVDHPDILNG